MNTNRNLIKGFLCAAAMGMLVLDSAAALDGAQEGIKLCIETVIPSLFPFFVLSILLTGTILGRESRTLSPLCRLFGVPYGAEGLLTAGFLGGYPVGAQCVSQAFVSGHLSAADARRMLLICNNCGPAFLFGMAGGIFDRWYLPWLLWAVQFAASLSVARLLPGLPHPIYCHSAGNMTLIQALERAIRVMASVCGWIIIFRLVISFFDRWFLWMLPTEIQVSISGLLELSNGCMELLRLKNTGQRFIFCAGMLNFGGICVILQTMGVTAKNMDRSFYFPGKALQGCIAVFFAWAIQLLVLPAEECWTPSAVAWVLLLICAIISGIILRKAKNKGSIPATLGV